MTSYQPLTFYYQEIDSTNDEALRLLDSHPPPFFVMAARQTSGRGRMGRRWHSPDGNLYFTAVFEATLQLRELPLFTLYASLRVCHAIARLTGANLWLKWPNDIWIGGKKCAGFLAESPVAPSYGRLLLLGIGLNVNTVDFPKDLSGIATSLKIETQKEWSLKEIGTILCGEIIEAYEKFSTQRYEVDMMTLWNRYEKLVGRDIKFEEDGVVHRGRVLGLSPDGSLNVNVNKKAHKLRSGEVTLSKFLRGDPMRYRKLGK